MILLKTYLLSFFLSMIPLTELRATVPWIMVTHGEQWVGLVIVAIIGNIIPAIILLWGLGLVDKFLAKRFNFFAKIYNKVLQLTRKKTQKKLLRYGYLALFLFVAIPLPGTGVWTGAIAAWLFGLPKRQSLITIILGTVLAAIIMTLISKGVLLGLSI